MHPINVVVRSSVIKYPPTRLFGHPAALINPKSRVLCAIIKKATKAVNTAPMAKINTPIKNVNCDKIAFKPCVNVPTAEAAPNPKRLLNNKRNKVEATLNVKVVIVMLV
jgi:hypothetical protein